MGKGTERGWRIGACLAGLGVVALVAALPSWAAGADRHAPQTAGHDAPPPPHAPHHADRRRADHRRLDRQGEGQGALERLLRPEPQHGHRTLRYWADFEGGGLEQTGGSHFTHSYTTDGVTRAAHAARGAGRRGRRGRQDRRHQDLGGLVRRGEAEHRLPGNDRRHGHPEAERASVCVPRGRWTRSIFRAFTVSGNTPLGSRQGRHASTRSNGRAASGTSTTTRRCGSSRSCRRTASRARTSRTTTGPSADRPRDAILRRGPHAPGLRPLRFEQRRRPEPSASRAASRSSWRCGRAS